MTDADVNNLESENSSKWVSNVSMCVCVCVCVCVVGGGEVELFRRQQNVLTVQTDLKMTDSGQIVRNFSF